MTTIYQGTQDTVKAERFFRVVCAYCGETFEAQSDRARYCCDAHRQAAYRERQTRKDGARA